MTDLELTRLAAEAMGLLVQHTSGDSVWRLPFSNDINDPRLSGVTHLDPYDPLHDDAQAMALVKKMNAFGFGFAANDYYEYRWFCMSSQGDVYESVSADLNRAIVECVAKMQAARCTDKVEL